MGTTTESKRTWLARLDRAEATWREIVAAAEAGDPTRPGAEGGGDWTFADVTAHLNGWRARSVDRLEAAVRDEEPPPPAWPDGLNDDTEAGVDAINRWIYDRNRGRPLPELLVEADDQFRRIRAAIEAVPEGDLLAPGRFPWLGGEPLSAVLAGSMEHLHEEHEPALRSWLAGP